MRKAFALVFLNMSLMVAGVLAATVDTCGYPYTDVSFPWTSTVFNESSVLIGGGLNSTQTAIVAWYSDEHALTLGVSQVNKKTSTGTTGYITASPAMPVLNECKTGFLNGCYTASSPTSLPVGVEVYPYAFDGYHRPMWPALFVTDITAGTPCANNALSCSGDWQSGNGHPLAPTAVYGTWKPATSLWDTTKTPNTVTITPGADPTGNNFINFTGYVLDSGEHNG